MQGKKITRKDLETHGFRVVRISFCLRRSDPSVDHHFHARILLKKLPLSYHDHPFINIKNRDSTNFGIINLLTRFNICADKTMRDY